MKLKTSIKEEVIEEVYGVTIIEFTCNGAISKKKAKELLEKNFKVIELRKAHPLR